MKKAILSIATILVAFCGFAQTTEEKEEIVSGPLLAFEEDSHDFGDIEQGDVVEWTFKFENKGIEPLIISNVAVTCGCTATKWPREPIPPGEKSEMTIKFDSAGKMGIQKKVIRVFSNSPESVTLVTINTNVLPKKKDR